jgi:preprotein translocase subunit YajC
MAESIEAFIAPLMFIVLAAIFYFVIELRIKMLKCRE